MSWRYWVFSTLGIALSLIGTSSFARRATAQEIILPSVEISTEERVTWASNQWPYNTTVIIESGGKMVGRAVLDRDGRDFYEKVDSLGTLGGLIKDPFSGPRPWRSILVSTWSSRTDGCFMDLVVQVAIPVELSLVGGQALSAYLVPTKVKLQFGNNPPEELQSREQPKIGGPYPYHYYNSSLDNWSWSGWHQGRNEFALSSKQAKKLLDAPPGEATLQLSFNNDRYKFYEYKIGKGTTQRWKDAYSFNPDCSPNAPSQPLPSNGKPYKPRGPFDYPSKNQFDYFDTTVERHRKSEVKFTADQWKQRQAFQRSWSNKTVFTNYLGSWSSGNQYYYIYPAARKQYVCLVTEKDSHFTYYVGRSLNPSALELRYVQYGNRADRYNALYWRNKSDVLAGRTGGIGELYPVFAVQRSVEIPTEMQQQFKEAGCPIAFVSPSKAEQLNVPYQGLSKPLAQLLSWLHPLIRLSKDIAHD